MYKQIVKARSAILVLLTHQLALPLLRLIRRPERFPYELHDLQKMDEGTLGFDLYQFITSRNLQLLPHYAKHDIKHILLAYDTTDEGEVCLQMFMMGNGHISFPVVATILYGFATMPEHWSEFVKAFRKGQAATQIAEWDWFGILDEQTVNLKKKITNEVPAFT